MIDWRGRGYIEVTPNGDSYDLMDWSEHYDSGASLGHFDTIERAIAAAREAQIFAPYRRIIVLGELFAEHRT
jgi:hypothetical protein